MKKIYYFCYYSNPENGRRRDANPAVDLQESYLAEVLSDLGYEVEIVGLNIPDSSDALIHIQKGFVKQLQNNVRVRYFTCVESKNRVFRYISRRLVYFMAMPYIRKMDKDAIIIFYHSRVFYGYYHLLNRLRKKYILEAEEIYSDVIGDEVSRSKELAEINRANAYILPSVPLAKIISQDKPFALYHGSCRREKHIGTGFRDDKIHVVYAGTLDRRVIGNMSMIYAAKYLDAGYHIHILGSGVDEEDMRRTLSAIDEMKDMPCMVSYEGVLLGEEYLVFLQSCHIGLFTRESDKADINSSFPSKIMSYLSNGLRVVASRADSLTTSDVSDLLFYVDGNDPRDVADAIRNIDIKKDYDSRGTLMAVEEELKNRLSHLIEGVFAGE